MAILLDSNKPGRMLGGCFPGAEVPRTPSIRSSLDIPSVPSGEYGLLYCQNREQEAAAEEAAAAEGELAQSFRNLGNLSERVIRHSAPGRIRVPAPARPSNAPILLFDHRSRWPVVVVAASSMQSSASV